MSEFMELAIEQAKIAFNNGDVPVGAVIVRNNEVLSCSYNKKNTENVAVYHAEILSIIDASKKIGTWYLDDCDIYVTLKPCDMCMYALAEARIRNVYYLLDSNYVDNLNKNYDKISVNKMNDVYEYSGLVSDFFKKLRD